MLTARTGLDDRVAFRCASALEMPFEDGSFDAAWSQHSSMNIDEKERLYTEVHRVLRPGGRFAFHEIMLGPEGAIHYPVPWARDPSISFLRPPDAVQQLLESTGFQTVQWIDDTSASIEWFRARIAAAAGSSAPPHLGLHLLLGQESATMFRNVLRNLEEGRLKIIKAVVTKA
jgi:SAM-dependent methyltransferase